MVRRGTNAIPNGGIEGSRVERDPDFEMSETARGEMTGNARCRDDIIAGTAPIGLAERARRDALGTRNHVVLISWGRSTATPVPSRDWRDLASEPGLLRKQGTPALARFPRHVGTIPRRHGLPPKTMRQARRSARARALQPRILRKTLAHVAIDDRTALASIQDGRTSAALRFHFDDTGEVVKISTPARYRTVKGDYLPTPWVVRCGDYQLVNGFRIPRRAEAEWLLPEGPWTYWRGRIVRIRYRVTPAAHAQICRVAAAM